MPEASLSDQIAANIACLRAAIADAARDVSRDPSAIEVMAVSKVQPDARIEAALAAGQRLFGENRVQEAQTRWAARRPRVPDLRLHLIGPLQTNKVKDALALFDAIESVDRPKLARVLAKELAAAPRPIELLVQVNTGAEPQKSGVLPADLEAFLDLCRGELSLPITGLMCIPPVEEAPAAHFAFLAELAERHGLATLSMGMSGDFPVAVRQGATRVRVGTGVFGAREG